MRRLARHLFTVCSAVSLLLCVAVCALWGRSYTVVDEAVYVVYIRPDADHYRIIADANRGTIHIGEWRCDLTFDRPVPTEAARKEWDTELAWPDLPVGAHWRKREPPWWSRLVHGRPLPVPDPTFERSALASTIGITPAADWPNRPPSGSRPGRFGYRCGPRKLRSRCSRRPGCAGGAGRDGVHASASAPPAAMTSAPARSGARSAERRHLGRMRRHDHTRPGCGRDAR